MGLTGNTNNEAYRETKGGPGAQKQEWPGTTADMGPAPDHGETSYEGTGKLAGKVALITGGDSGIGRAVAIAYAKEGADVAIAYYNEHEDAEDTAEHVRAAGRKVLLLPCDLNEPEACRRIVEDTVQEFGKLDILINNAAYQCEHDFFEVTPDEVERTFRTNIMAYLYCAQAAAREMKDGGVILNTGSVTGLEGKAKLVPYAATKAAIHNLTQTLADALADKGIRVNAVAPGPVWTPLIPATLEKDHVERFGGDTRQQRPAQPIEIATSYVFLASEDGRFYSGEIFAPTGRGATR